MYDLFSSKLSEKIKNIQEAAIRGEYKLRVYVEYCVPSLRYLMTVHELTDSQLDLLGHLHTNTVKAFLGLSSRGPTPAFIHSPNGLAIPRLSDVYVESHNRKMERYGSLLAKRGPIMCRNWFQGSHHQCQ